ncbi:MAG: M48 family metalloprotease [Neisseriaceae bacterium]|nr:M48 family metalloprotease [Neisseriaceae bacterium]
MNFYRQQELARRQEKIMLLLFFIASIFLTVIITQAIDLGLRILYWGTHKGKETIEPSSTLLWLVSILFMGSILYLSLRKIKKLSNSDESVMAMGGIPLNQIQNIDSLKKNQLRNTIEEMAISAGILVPKIYILENESGINAFSMGLRPADMTVIFTQGCLVSLSRDELQGIVAYQIAQIINGHTRLNTLVYGVLFGLQFAHSGIGTSLIFTDSDGKTEMNHPTIIASAFPLWIVTYIGHFFAKIIKSIICRENVFESDGTAVQLTRNPQGIASVLQKSLDPHYSSLIYADAFLQDMEHLLFTFGNNPKYEFKILYTHPETKKRIRNILPRWRESALPKTTFQNTSSPSGKTSYAKGLPIPETAAAALGVSETLARQAKKPVSDQDYWLNAARQPETSPAVVVALLAQHNQNPQACLDIAEMFHSAWKKTIDELLQHPLSNEQRFILLSIALPNVKLQIIGEENVNRYKKFLQNIIKSDQQITLFEHCVYAAVSGSLKTSMTAGLLPPIPKSQLYQEMSELLMLTAQYSSSKNQAEQIFQAACEYCDIPLTPYQNNIALSRLSLILHSLNRLSLPDKQDLMESIRMIVDFDQQRSNDEKNWIDAMSIALL